MSETIGKRLRAARVAKGMSIEDAAFETRIQPSYIRGLEHDDYSGFASTTYAKSFLTLYSRYLSVEAEDALQYFAGSDDIRISGPGFMPTLSSAVATSPAPGRRENRPAASRADSPGFAPMLLGGVVLLLVVAIPVLWYIGKDAGSIEEATSKAKSIADATRQEIKTAAAGSENQNQEVPADTAPQTPVVTPEPAIAAPQEAISPSVPVPSSVPPMPLAQKGSSRGAAADWVLDSTRPEIPSAPKSTETAPKKPATPITAVPVAEDTLGVQTNAPEPGVVDLPPAPETTVRAVPAAPLHANPIAIDTDPFASAPEPPAAAKGGDKGKSKAAPAEEAPKPVVAAPAAPASGPIRATPLIAVPFVPEAEPATEEKKPEEPAFTDPRNRFPRPVEPEN
jgi:cytoskeletal protein RodZ